MPLLSCIFALAWLISALAGSQPSARPGRSHRPGGLRSPRNPAKENSQSRVQISGCETSGNHGCGALYQGTTLVGPETGAAELSGTHACGPLIQSTTAVTTERSKRQPIERCRLVVHRPLVTI